MSRELHGEVPSDLIGRLKLIVFAPFAASRSSISAKPGR